MLLCFSGKDYSNLKYDTLEGNTNFFWNTKQDIHSAAVGLPVPSIFTNALCGTPSPFIPHREEYLFRRYLPAPYGNSHRFYPLQGNSLLKYACPLVYFASVQTSQHRSSRAIHVNIFHQSSAIDSKYSSLCCKSGPKAPLQRTYSWRGCRRET